MSTCSSLCLPRDVALKAFIWEFPPKLVPGSEETKPVAAPIMGDTYALAGSGVQKNWAWMDLDFLPGQHEIAIMLPPVPSKCRVDGVLAGFRYDRPWHLAHLALTTPALPVSPINLGEGNAWVEKFDLDQRAVGRLPPARAMEDLGPVPYGYVKYRAQFESAGSTRMFISTLADDAKKVFINGTLVMEASNSKPQVDFNLRPMRSQGTTFWRFLTSCSALRTLATIWAS